MGGGNFADVFKVPSQLTELIKNEGIQGGLASSGEPSDERFSLAPRTGPGSSRDPLLSPSLLFKKEGRCKELISSNSHVSLEEDPEPQMRP